MPHEFYAALFFNDDDLTSNGIEESLSHIILPELDVEDTTLCDVDIDKVKFWATLNTVSNNKSYGPNGFLAEFYKTF